MKKSHWLILLAVVVLIGIYFIARSRQPVEKQIRFFTADSSAIAKMEFITAEDTIIVSKAGKVWKLAYPLAWDVNEQQLTSFFQKVLPLKTSVTPMSENPGLQNMYKVDSLSAFQVILRDKTGSILDHAYIGNGTDTSFDYGRKKGDSRIYQFKDNITNLVSPDIFQWRSPRIISLKRQQIKSIDVSYSKNSYTLTLEGDSIRFADSRESFTIPPYNRAQFKLINALENLMTWQFIDKDIEQFEPAFKKPACTIVIHLNDNETRKLTLAENFNSDAAKLNGSSSEEPLILLRIGDQSKPLYQMTTDFINRFTKSSGHFKSQYD